MSLQKSSRSDRWRAAIPTECEHLRATWANVSDQWGWAPLPGVGLSHLPLPAAAADLLPPKAVLLIEQFFTPKVLVFACKHSMILLQPAIRCLGLMPVLPSQGLSASTTGTFQPMMPL